MLRAYIQIHAGPVCWSQSNITPHGWSEDNKGHLLSVCFLWCAATKRCSLPEHPGVPTCVTLYPGRDELADVPRHSLQAPLVEGRKPACLAKSRNNSSSVRKTGLNFRFACVFCLFVSVFWKPGGLHNHAIINLNWSSLAGLQHKIK